MYIVPLSKFMRDTLFTKNDAEVTPQLHAATFDLSELPQVVDVRMAPDQEEPSFTINEGRIGHFRARRSKKSSAWRLLFTVTCAPASDHQLAQIVACRAKQRICSFEDASPDLFSVTGEQRRKVAKAERAAGIGVESAVAH